MKTQNMLEVSMYDQVRWENKMLLMTLCCSLIA